MGSYTTTKGDLFEHLGRYLKKDLEANIIIPHVCNNQGAWGAGFVLSIDKWDTGPGEAYKLADHHPMGQTQFVTCHDQDHVVVANMIAQDLGTKGERLKYAALGNCMYDVVGLAKHLSAQIWCPKFGCGLAGGDWRIIEPMIRQCWVDDAALNVKVFYR